MATLHTEDREKRSTPVSGGEGLVCLTYPFEEMFLRTKGNILRGWYFSTWQSSVIYRALVFHAYSISVLPPPTFSVSPAGVEGLDHLCTLSSHGLSCGSGAQGGGPESCSGLGHPELPGVAQGLAECLKRQKQGVGSIPQPLQESRGARRKTSS